MDAGIDRLTGKRVQVSRTVEGTRRDAERVLNTLISKHETASVGGSTTATFSALLTAWLEQVEPDLAYQTVQGYKRLVRNHIEPALGSIKLRKLDVATLDSFYRALPKKGLAPASVRQAHAVIRSALKQGVKWDWVPINAAEKASPPRLRKASTRPPTPEEVGQLVARAAAGRYPEFAVMLHLAVITGARRGELCGLRWTDVNDQRAELLIQRSIFETLEHEIVEKETKTHQARRIALDEWTMAELSRHRALMEARAEFCGVMLDPTGYVFSDHERGVEPWRPDRAHSRSSGSALNSRSKASASTTSATSRPRACCPLESTCEPSPAASATQTPLQLSALTRTSWEPRTVRQQKHLGG